MAKPTKSTPKKTKPAYKPASKPAPEPKTNSKDKTDNAESAKRPPPSPLPPSILPPTTLKASCKDAPPSSQSHKTAAKAPSPPPSSATPPPEPKKLVLKANTASEILDVILAAVSAQDPHELPRAKEDFLNIHKILADRMGVDMNHPSLAAEFPVWFCADYNITGTRMSPAHWFRRRFGPMVDEKTRRFAQALERSVHSYFDIKERKDKAYTIVDCWTEQEYKVTTLDMHTVESGSALATRIVRWIEPDDGIYHFQGLVMEIAPQITAECRKKAAEERRKLDVVRAEFISHFKRTDPVFASGKEAYEKMMEFQLAALKADSERTGSPMPPQKDLDEMSKVPKMLEDSNVSWALVFETNGLALSRDYPPVVAIFEGAVKDEELNNKVLRELIEDDTKLPVNTIRRIFEQYKDTAVRQLSALYPEVKTYDDVKKLLERKRCEPYELTPMLSER